MVFAARSKTWLARSTNTNDSYSAFIFTDNTGKELRRGKGNERV